MHGIKQPPKNPIKKKLSKGNVEFSKHWLKFCSVFGFIVCFMLCDNATWYISYSSWRKLYTKDVPFVQWVAKASRSVLGSVHTYLSIFSLFDMHKKESRKKFKFFRHLIESCAQLQIFLYFRSKKRTFVKHMLILK